MESILREKGDGPGELSQSIGKRVPLKGQIWSLMLDVKRWQEQKKSVLIYLNIYSWCRLRVRKGTEAWKVNLELCWPVSTALVWK